MASAAVVEARTAVGSSVDDLRRGSTVLVACSGGPDSLALAGAAAWVGQRHDLRVVAVVVDHGLQPGSAEVAHEAARICGLLGVDDATVVAVDVGRSGGLEAAARDARYAALQAAARSHGADTVLLGHTLDDQAETVLLRMSRGSGARSLSAMAPVTGLWRRPFLGIPRTSIHAACAEQLAPLGLESWRDPHNDDDAFSRVRVRQALTVMREALGESIVEGLARTATLARADADALDALADEAYDLRVQGTNGGLSAEVVALQGLSPALRWRVIRRMALELGAPADAMGSDHVMRVDAFIVDWHGQGEARLPGGVTAARAYGRLSLQRGVDSEVFERK